MSDETEVKPTEVILPFKRDGRGLFQPGTRPGPGKPREYLKLSEIDAGAVADVLGALHKMALDTKVKPATRVAAASAFLDRVVGKPSQALDPVQLEIVNSAKLQAEATVVLRDLQGAITFRRPK
jgi:hypothetical protein